jgi:LPS-assembly lipoprotein
MKSRRDILCFAAASALSACGFEPLHATRSGDRDLSRELASIRIAPIANRSGQTLRNQLLDRLTPLGQPQAARYTLNISLVEPRQTLSLRRDDVISRSSYSATAAYELIDNSGKRVSSGASSFTTDYEITSSEYATLISLQDARDRVLELVSEDIRGQLAVFFRTR